MKVEPDTLFDCADIRGTTDIIQKKRPRKIRAAFFNALVSRS